MKKHKYNLFESFNIIGAAILGLLGPKAQKQAMESIGKSSRKAVSDPCPLYQALTRKKVKAMLEERERVIQLVTLAIPEACEREVYVMRLAEVVRLLKEMEEI